MPVQHPYLPRGGSVLRLRGYALGNTYLHLVLSVYFWITLSILKRKRHKCVSSGVLAESSTLGETPGVCRFFEVFIPDFFFCILNCGIKTLIKSIISYFQIFFSFRITCSLELSPCPVSLPLHARNLTFPPRLSLSYWIFCSWENFVEASSSNLTSRQWSSSFRCLRTFSITRFHFTPSVTKRSLGFEVRSDLLTSNVITGDHYTSNRLPSSHLSTGWHPEKPVYLQWFVTITGLICDQIFSITKLIHFNFYTHTKA